MSGGQRWKRWPGEARRLLRRPRIHEILMRVSSAVTVRVHRRQGIGRDARGDGGGTACHLAVPSSVLVWGMTATWRLVGVWGRCGCCGCCGCCPAEWWRGLAPPSRGRPLHHLPPTRPPFSERMARVNHGCPFAASSSFCPSSSLSPAADKTCPSCLSCLLSQLCCCCC